MAEENKIDTSAQKLELFRALDAAERDGNDREKLNIYKQLQSLYIADEDYFDKAGVAVEATGQGINKGLANTLGLPADLSNLVIGLGETGVRKLLDAAGFEIESGLKDSKLMSKKPFLGSAQVTEIFNALGIETEYDKTRALSAMTGRIAEEVGMTMPIAGPLAKGAAKPAQFLQKEAGITVAAGTGAATAQQMFPGSTGAEITGQLVGGFSPTTLKVLMKYAGAKTGAVEAFNLFYNPRQREKEIAGNILYQRLGPEKSAKLIEQIKKGKVTIFGDEVDATKFPRTLDQITAEPELIVLRQQIEKSNVGTGLIDAIEETKVARLLELENNFVNKIKKKDYGIEATIGAVEDRVNHITNYLDKRLELAKKTAADKVQAINPNMTREQASALLRREIDEALQDALSIEQKMWSNVEGTINGDIISTGAAAILNNQLKTTDPKNVPKILYDLAGEKNLIKAGLQEQTVTKQPIGPGLGTREVVVEPKGSLLTDKEPISEILNLRTRVLDDIRLENSKSMPNKEKLQSLDDLLGIINQSFTDSANPKNLSTVTQAINYSDNLANNFYKSEVGKILGYDSKGKLKVIPEATFNKLIQQGETGGVATKDINKITRQDASGVEEGLKNRFAQLADADGNIPPEVIDQFIKNNEEALIASGLKDQFLDVAESANILAQQQQKFNVINRDVQKYRLETLASKDGQTLSAKGIVTSIFNAKDPVRDINNVIKLSKRDPSGAALEGLRNEVTDFMLNKIKTREIVVGGQSQIVPDIKQLNTFIKKNDEALKALYGDDGFEIIQEFQSIAKNVDNAVMAGGMEDLEVIARNNVFVSSVGRILGTKVAAATGGPALVFAGIGGRVANALISKRSANEIKGLLSKSFSDPEFARELLKPYVDNQQEIVSKAVNTFIVNAFGEQVREEVMPEISIEFPNATIDDTGTIQPKEEEVPVSMNTINPASRLSNVNMVEPITNTGPMNMNTMARGQQLFGGPGEITFAAQGGIMNARKPMQRVA